MNRLRAALLLPAEITLLERRYLARVNRLALQFFAAHVPVFAVIAALNHTGVLLALALTSAVLAGPLLAHYTLSNPRHVSVIHGVTAMFMGGILVHLGQGPMQIEMHFYFFALLAMLAVFANPLVVVAAAVTVALHHVVLWLVLPRSVFNYDASFGVVLVHAGFVVLESVATCFFARGFFDNGLARTAELDAKNRDLRLVLDSVEQGFLTIDGAGAVSRERSRAVEMLLGTPREGESWFTWLRRASPDFAKRTEAGWSEVTAGIMPEELTLGQLPTRLTWNGRTLRVEYRPIQQETGRYLVIVTDVTTDVQRELLELERDEAMALFHQLLADRVGFETFFEEARSLVLALTSDDQGDPVRTRRQLHTLKGNAGLFGIKSLASICHQLEDELSFEERWPPRAFDGLVARWSRLATDVKTLLGHGARGIDLSEEQHGELVHAARSGEPREALVQRLLALKLEPTRHLLDRFAVQARELARRLDKAGLEVRVEDHGVRLDAQRWRGFWSAFTHAVRNAVDHGVEAPEARVAAGKSASGLLSLRTSPEQGRLVIEIADDGPGIDWVAVSRVANADASATPEDLENALFSDGVSTAQALTEVSGRGVGMGALRLATRELGGEVRVLSTPRHGTTVRMTFPLTTAYVPTTVAPSAAA